MKSIKQILRWPAMPGNGLNPGYVILWRALWWIPLLASMGLTWCLVLIIAGLDEANDYWARAK